MRMGILMPKLTKEKAMGNGIYTYYKERLIEIGGNNKCLYLKSIVRKSAYDLGALFEGRDEKISEFVNFLWAGGKFPLTVISNKEKQAILRNLDTSNKTAKIMSDINSGISSVSTFVLLAVAPLNLIKGVSISLLTMLLYKRVARPLFGK